jgi:thiosulfate/3-mercaptopyruvate sulfurtransferase
MNGIVTTDWLAAHLDAPDLRIVDVRWYMDDPGRGRQAYLEGHIPGAVFMDVDKDLSAPGGMRGAPRGRHPWPDAWQVARVMGASGIGTDTRVVAYDDLAGAIAARLWFLLRAYGHEAVAVLDGGLRRWEAEGRALTTELPEIAPQAFGPRPQPGMVLDKLAVRALPEGAVILDARSPERYRGETEPIDPRAGHIPGARSAFHKLNLTDEPAPVFRPPDELRERYDALGARDAEPVVYCGSGVTACHDLLALHLAGRRGRLYSGSWSEWSSDPRLPAVRGPEPGRS